MVSGSEYTNIIGPNTLVDFPEYNLEGVPAKIDTGADSSTIWANDVKETANEGLTFTLFGTKSVYYARSPMVASAKSYKQVLIKNSSGVEELRYKVRLLVTINGRNIRAWFTLADRTNMRYPVLLGRRLLKNKFIVDVGRLQPFRQNKKTYRVLVLSSKMPDKVFFDQVTKEMDHNVEFVTRSLKQLIFWLKPGQIKVYEAVTHQDIAKFDLVYFKSHHKCYEFAVAASEYLTYHNVRYFDQELTEHMIYDKLTATMRLVLRGIAIPETVCGSTEILKMQGSEIIKKLGHPYVCKEINSAKSRKNYLLDNEADLLEILSTSTKDDIYLLQKYISSEGYVRALVLGAETKLIIQRTKIHNDNPRKAHLNTAMKAGNTALIPVNQTPIMMRRLASTAARVMLCQIAGVDLIKNSLNGQWLVLEVNSAPQIYSGAFPAEKRSEFAKFIDYQLDR